MHLFASLQTEHIHFLNTNFFCCHRGIYRDFASADYHHPGTGLYLFILTYRTQKIDCTVDKVVVHTR